MGRRQKGPGLPVRGDGYPLAAKRIKAKLGCLWPLSLFSIGLVAGGGQARAGIIEKEDVPPVKELGINSWFQLRCLPTRSH